MTNQPSLFEQASKPADDAETLTLSTFAERAYLDYAVSVVKGRALPDVSDGQKPVQRRILYAMNELGLGPTAKPRKSAAVVGDVLGKLHPHGDQSVYDALVRMAQDFSLRYPLIDGQGNFGSRDGDGAAAMRYTEARLTPIARLLMDEIDMGTVDSQPNYDGSTNEPRTLPARGKKPIQKLYALDDGELLAIEDKLKKEGLKEGVWGLSRFKGLGEMNAEQLWETTLNPDTRRLLPVRLSQTDVLQTREVMTQLMGKGEAAARRAWIEEHGNETEADI